MATMSELPLQIRPLRPDDTHHILCSWKQSLLNSPTFAWLKGSHQGTSAFWAEMNDRCDGLLESSSVLVASGLDDDADCIIGWIVYSDKFVHYCYVKSQYRRMGVFRKLLRSAEPNGCWEQDRGEFMVRLTHWTDDCEALVQHGWSLFYYPSGVTEAPESDTPAHQEAL